MRTPAETKSKNDARKQTRAEDDAALRTLIRALTVPEELSRRGWRYEGKPGREKLQPYDISGPHFSFRLCVDGFSLDCVVGVFNVADYIKALRRGGARKIELIG